MKSQERKHIMVVRFLRPLIHGAAIIFSFISVSTLRKVTDLIPFVQLRIPLIDMKETIMFACIAAGIFLVIGLIWGLYELFRPIHAYYKKFLSTWGIWMLTISFVAYMGFGYLFVSGVSRFVLVIGGVVVFILITILDTFINKINAYLEKKKPYRVVILGNSADLIQEVEDSLSLYSIYSTHHFGTLDVNESVIKLADIVVVTGALTNDELQTIADRVRIAGKTFYHTNDTFFLDDLIAKPHRIGPIMAMEYRASPLEGRWRVVKRAFDLIVSSFAIVLLSPLLLLIAIIIKIDSKGPAFYVHKRVGKSGREFNFIKFRSMYTHLSVGDNYGGDDARALKKELMDSELNVRKGSELQKIENDPRVTRVGRFLRKTSLDEIPNLFSVWWGSMSLVGPRPHELFEVEKYQSWQKRLLSIKPGMTGYAQLFGRDKLAFAEEAKLDLYYIQNWSVTLDVYVLVSTVKVVLRGS